MVGPETRAWETVVACGSEASIIPGITAILSNVLSLLANSSTMRAFCCLSCSIVPCCAASSHTAGVPGVVGRGKPAKSDSESESSHREFNMKGDCSLDGFIRLRACLGGGQSSLTLVAVHMADVLS